MSDQWHAPEQRRSRRLEHLSNVHRSINRRRQERELSNSVLAAAEASDDPYLSKLARTSRRVATVGLDGKEFFRSPGAYQALLERDDSSPDGFLDRMWARARDGDLLNQRGRVGFDALMGTIDLEAGLARGADLRSQMTASTWLEPQRGFEKQAGFVMEMAGQQFRNLPTALLSGAAAVGAGAAVGAVGGPGGALAGAGAAFGFGFGTGMFAENSMMMAGLTFLDLMEEPLVLPDGTETRMPFEVARNVALVIGTINGIIETRQMGTIAGKTPGVRAARQAMNKVVTRMVSEGTVRRLAARAGGQIIAGAAENVAQEAAQEFASMVGAEIALEMTRNKTGAERAEAMHFGKELVKRIGEVASLAPAFGMMSTPMAAGQAVASGMADRTAKRQMSKLFDQGVENGQEVAITDLVVPDKINEKQMAMSRVLIQQAQRGVPLKPLSVTTDEDGTMSVVSPDDQAMIAALQDMGVQRVRIIDTTAVAEAEAREKIKAQQEAAGEGAGGAPTEEQVEEVLEPPDTPAVEVDAATDQPRAAAAPRPMDAFEEVRQMVVEAAEQAGEGELTDEQINAFTIVLEQHAAAAGEDLRTHVQELFRDGMLFTEGDEAEALLRRRAPAPVIEQEIDRIEPEPTTEIAEDTPETTSVDEQVTEPEDQARDDEERQDDDEAAGDAVEEEPGEPGEPAVAPAGGAVTVLHPPTVDQVEIDPQTLQVGDASAGNQIVVWESNAGENQVIAGGWRAGIAQRYRERIEEPFHVPVLRYREADGVSLEQAQQLAQQLHDPEPETITSVAEYLRELPRGQEMREQLPLPNRAQREARALVELTDPVWYMVRRGELDPAHAAAIAENIPQEDQAHGAVAFTTNPPASDYEAQVRAQGMVAGPESPENLAKGKLLDAVLNTYRRWAVAGDGKARHDAAVINSAAIDATLPGMALHDVYSREKLGGDELVGRWIHYVANYGMGDVDRHISELAAAGDQEYSAARVEQTAAQVLDAMVRARVSFLEKQSTEQIRPAEVRERIEDQPQPKVTWKKAAIVPTREGVKAVEIPDAPEPSRDDALREAVYEQEIARGTEAGLTRVEAEATYFDRWPRYQVRGSGDRAHWVDRWTGNRSQFKPFETAEAEAQQKNRTAMEYAVGTPEQEPAAVEDATDAREEARQKLRNAMDPVAIERAFLEEPDEAKPQTEAPEAAPAAAAEPEPATPAPTPQAVPEEPAYVETKKQIAPAMLSTENAIRPVEWEVDTGWYTGAAAFRTEKMPAALRRHAEQYAGEVIPRVTWGNFIRGTGNRPNLLEGGVEAEIVASHVEPDGFPIAAVRQIGGELTGYYDDRYVRFIRTQWKGQAKLFLRGQVLVAEVDGEVVALVMAMKPSARGAGTLSEKMRQAARPGKDRRAVSAIHPRDVASMRPDREPTAKAQYTPKKLAGDGAVLPDGKVIDARNPDAEDAAAAPPVKPKAVKVEDASAEDLVAGIVEMWQSESEETNLLYSDGVQTEGKLGRAIVALVERVMIDRGIIDWGDYADAIMAFEWGPMRDRARRQMRSWYEMARNAGIAADMTPADQIDQWYIEQSDELAEPGQRPAERGQPGAEPGAAEERGVRDVRERPRAGDEGDVRAPDEGQQRPESPSSDEGRGDSPGSRGDSARRAAGDADSPVAENWRFEPGALHDTETRGPTQKARDNIAAIELLKVLETEGRQANPLEQSILAKYVGWGGLSGAFPAPGTTDVFNKGFEEVGARLRELLTDEEYDAARGSIQFAHYTSEPVISTMWDTVRAMGFHGGRVLEPGAGVGHFAGVLPGDMADRGTYTGIELDRTSAAIAAQLYPKWNIRQADFIQFKAPAIFDVVIGNPPFARTVVMSDPKYRTQRFMLHDYFFAKGIDAVRTGGVLAFVTSAGTMNKQDTKARQYLADRADFLGGIRLPNTAFKRNAGTEVTTDVLFFRRRAEGAEPNHVAPWVETVEIEMPTRAGDTQPGHVNEYFNAHPDQVLGEGGLFDELVAGLRYAVRERKGANFEADLQGAAQRLIAAMPAAPVMEPQDLAAAAIQEATATEKEGSFVLTDEGELRQYRGGVLEEPRRPGSQGKRVKLSKAQVEIVKKILPLRDSYRASLAADIAGDADAGADARLQMNEAHDAFVAEYGPLGKTKTRRQRPNRVQMETLRFRAREAARERMEPWEEGSFDDQELIAAKAKRSEIAKARAEAREAARVAGEPWDEGSFDPDAQPDVVITKYPNLEPFRGDPENYRVAALEGEYDEATDTAPKGPAFTSAAIRRAEVPTIETAEDAMVATLSATGRFDLQEIAKAWKRPEAETIEALGELAYEDPKAGWVLGEEYLAGNVVEKLAIARRRAEQDPRFTRNVTALEAVQPKTVPPSEIDIRIGSSWVPPQVFVEFAADALGMFNPQVAHNPQLGRWTVSAQRADLNQASNAEWGARYPDGETLQFNSLQVFRALLSGRPLKGRKERVPRPEGGYTERSSPENDARAAEAEQHMRDAFDKWVWNDQARSEHLVDAYNGLFNTEAERTYRTDYLTMPGAAAWWQWRPHQLRGIARGLMSGNTYLAHAVGAGKAQWVDSHVLTPFGWCRMGDVEVGDPVIAGDGSVARVTGVFPQGKKKLYKVTFSDGSSTECCDEHLWLTQTYKERSAASAARRNGKHWASALPQVRPLEEIRQSLVAPHLNAKNHSIPLVNPVQFYPQSVPVPAYTLGVLLGDGGVSGRCVRIHTEDREIIDAVAAELPGEVKLSENASSGCPVWSIVRREQAGYGADREPNPLRERLVEMGVAGCRAHEKFVPDVYKFNAPEVRLAVLQGLMDTDGSVSKSGHSTYFYTVSDRLADDVVFLVQSLGGTVSRSIKTPHYTHNGERRAGLPAHVLCVSLRSPFIPFRLPRKKERVIPKTIYAPQRYIVSVEPSRVDEAQCIAIDHPSHLYVTDDFIVTHNTATMIGLAMEMKRLGIASKPMFVVPNAVLTHFSTEWSRLYPMAKLLIADDTNFHTTRRWEFVARAGAQEWDGVVMTFESWDKIPVSDELFEELVQQEIDEVLEALENTDKDDRITRKQLEQKRDQLRERLSERKKAKQDDVYTFEEMGVSHLFIDEAHRFRKLSFSTTMGTIKGITPDAGPTSRNAWMKTRHIERVNPGRGLVFASGTPITNTLAELYTVQRFLDTPSLKTLGIGMFDDWASAFGKMLTEAEPSLGGEYKFVTRFADIANPMELSRIVRKFMDVVLPNELRQYVTVPEHESGDREKVHVDKTPTQAAYYAELANRFKMLEMRKGPPKKGEDNHLTLISDGRMAAVDVRLFPGRGNGPREYTKLEQMIDNVYAIWEANPRRPFHEARAGGYEPEPAFHGQATQIVFSSLGYTRGEGRLFLPDYFRQELVERGIPSEQIAWIGDYTTHDKKRRLFNDMNEGKVTILIGSEESIGTGVNVQRRLYTAHNLGPGWFPSMDEQRVGRVMRQGNMNPRVRIIDYSTRASYDSNMWQLMSAKAGFIEAFFRGDPTMKNVKNVGDQSTYAMAAAMTTRDPRALKLAEMRRDLKEAERAREATDDRTWNRRSSQQRLTDQLSAKRARLNKWRHAMTQHVDTAGDKFRMVVGNTPHDDRSDAGDALLELLRADTQSSGQRGTLGGFRIMQTAVDDSVRAWVELQDETGFPILSREVTAAESGRGLVASFEAHLRRLGETERSQEANVKRDEQALASLAGDVVDDAPTRAEIDRMRAAVNELEAELTKQPDETEEAIPEDLPDVEEDEVLQQTYNPAADRWEMGGQQYRSLTEAEPDRREALQRRETARDAAGRVQVQEAAEKRLVDAHGTVTDIQNAGYVLWDGRMLPRTVTGRPESIMSATSAVQVDTRTRTINGAGALSPAQIAAILEMDTSPGIRLQHVYQGQELLIIRTDQELSERTLRAAFSRPDPPTLTGDRQAYGATLFDDANKAVMALGSAANFDTLMHELAHVFRRNLSAAQEEAVAEWAGARRKQDGTWSWNKRAEETFANGFVDWLREGQSPNDAVKTVFAKIKRWLRAIYAGVRSELPSQVRQVFEEIILTDDAPQVHAFERIRRNLANVDEATFNGRGGERIHVRRAGGRWIVDGLYEDGSRGVSREHPDVDSVAREIAGLRTIENPAPMGNRTMRMEEPETTADRQRDAELRVESGDMTVGEIADEEAPAAGESEERVLQQEDQEALTPEERLHRQRLKNLELARRIGGAQARGRRRGREEGAEAVARAYEKRDIVRHARQRILQIRNELAEVLRGSRTMPAEIRELLRAFIQQLDIGRRGRSTPQRVTGADTDPMRLLPLINDMVADLEDRPPGLPPKGLRKPLRDLTLIELEQVLNLVKFYEHGVREAQAGLQEGYRQEAADIGNQVVNDLSRADPVKLPAAIQGLAQFLGERPYDLISRIGGVRTALSKVMWWDIKQGAVKKRRTVYDAERVFAADLRAAGIERTPFEMERWLREKIEVPEWAQGDHTWRRGDLMTLALMWNDPYARRNLTSRNGGIVFTDRGRQATKVTRLTADQARELIALLDDEARAYIGAPVRNLFDSMYRQLNEVFKRKYGYDLERAPNYFPIQVAAMAVPDDPEAGGALDHYRSQGGDATAAPFQGMVQWRTGAVKPMVLRPINSAINRSVEHAAAYIGLEIPLTAARRLMANRQVTAMMADRFGGDIPALLKKYLRDQAGRGEPQGLLDRALTTLRHNVTVASLGLNPKVALSQALSLPIYAVHIPLKYVMRGVVDFASPKRAREILRLHTVMDPDFAARTNMSFDPDLVRGSAGIGIVPPDRTAYARTRAQMSNVLMSGVSFFDRLVVARGMQGAVHHAMDAFAGETAMTKEMQDVLGLNPQEAAALSTEERMVRAYDWARWVTERTQPSFLPENLSHFARGRWERFLTSFSGYTNVALNELRRTVREAKDADFQDPEANRRAAMAVTTILVFNPLGVAALGYGAAVLRGRDPDEFWKMFVSGWTALVFGVRDIAYFILQGGGPGDIDTPTADAVKELVRAGNRFGAALGSGDEERILAATEAVTASGLRIMGVPYWTPKSYIAGVVEALD